MLGKGGGDRNSACPAHDFRKGVPGNARSGIRASNGLPEEPNPEQRPVPIAHRFRALPPPAFVENSPACGGLVGNPGRDRSGTWSPAVG